MATYRSKPIEAFKWTGGPDQTDDPKWFVDALNAGKGCFYGVGKPYFQVLINTPNGQCVAAHPGDYIIRNESGEISTCEGAVFEQTYELTDQ